VDLPRPKAKIKVDKYQAWRDEQLAKEEANIAHAASLVLTAKAEIDAFVEASSDEEPGEGLDESPEPGEDDEEPGGEEPGAALVDAAPGAEGLSVHALPFNPVVHGVVVPDPAISSKDPAPTAGLSSLKPGLAAAVPAGIGQNALRRQPLLPASLSGPDRFRTNVPAMQRIREGLPAWGFREQLVATLDQNQVMIVSGATGCGKSTQVPQFLLDHLRHQGQRANIICTQPRRICAIGVA
jgi:hypothetical protein